jgi:serine phosphatase RsbU (regulator of sigma subunit)/CHASE2 domain-containing sensor protein
MAVLAFALAVQVADPRLLRELQNRGFDVAQRLSPLSPGKTVVQVVAIDEESLKRFGQWPWPRTLVADLVRRIAAGKPLVLGVDILFPEADRLSPPALAQSLRDLPGPLAEALASLPSSDSRLAEAFLQVPAVLGAAPSNEPVAATATPSRVALVLERGGDPRPFLTSYKSVVRSVPDITRTAQSQAALTDEPDVDGVVRAVPLLTLAGGQLIPTFALEALRIGAGIPSITVTTAATGIESVTLGDVVIPTDRRGRAYLHFGPPRARFVSAAKVLDPGFDPGLFDKQIVLVGVTGLGILDQKLTPWGLTQGIDVHAQMIEAILEGSLLHHPASTFWIELAMLLLAAPTIIWLIRYDTPRLATLGALGIAALLVAGEFAAFRFAGWLVDGIYPAGVSLLTFGAMLGGHLRATQAARRRLADELEHERQVTARLEGELTAARAIQMGLLPHHFPAFPERNDIDLFARIEPARAVGGDLFDFLLIDASRLFFIIADVSGKGIPAALFMAMTKEVVRDAVQRHGAQLGQVLAEANSKTAAASNEMDMMFVTAFAGVLDLSSGELQYASAGHDRPFLIRDGKGLRQLETEGGPPLGVIDDFPFPVERDRLDGGAVLLLYTDGVTEAQDEAGGFYSAQRLSQMLSTTPGQSARTVVDACFDAVRRFVGKAEQADDITVLAIRRGKEEPAG